MISVEIKNIKEVLKNKAELENKLGVKIKINGKVLSVESEPFNEFEAQRVFDAISLGFSVEKAIKILDEEINFIKVRIKDHANTKNYEVVRSRLIGTHGKTKKTIQEITKCDIVIHDNIVGIIGSAESTENALIAVVNIIKGTKQANAYRYLERMNAKKRELNKK